MSGWFPSSNWPQQNPNLWLYSQMEGRGSPVPGNTRTNQNSGYYPPPPNAGGSWDHCNHAQPASAFPLQAVSSTQIELFQTSSPKIRDALTCRVKGNQDYTLGDVLRLVTNKLYEQTGHYIAPELQGSFPAFALGWQQNCPEDIDFTFSCEPFYERRQIIQQALTNLGFPLRPVESPDVCMFLLEIPLEDEWRAEISIFFKSDLSFAFSIGELRLDISPLLYSGTPPGTTPPIYCAGPSTFESVKTHVQNRQLHAAWPHSIYHGLLRYLRKIFQGYKRNPTLEKALGLRFARDLNFRRLNSVKKTFSTLVGELNTTPPELLSLLQFVRQKIPNSRCPEWQRHFLDGWLTEQQERLRRKHGLPSDISRFTGDRKVVETFLQSFMQAIRFKGDIRDPGIYPPLFSQILRKDLGSQQPATKYLKLMNWVLWLDQQPGLSHAQRHILVSILRQEMETLSVENFSIPLPDPRDPRAKAQTLLSLLSIAHILLESKQESDSRALIAKPDDQWEISNESRERLQGYPSRNRLGDTPPPLAPVLLSPIGYLISPFFEKPDAVIGRNLQLADSLDLAQLPTPLSRVLRELLPENTSLRSAVIAAGRLFVPGFAPPASDRDMTVKAEFPPVQPRATEPTPYEEVPTPPQTDQQAAQPIPDRKEPEKPIEQRSAELFEQLSHGAKAQRLKALQELQASEEAWLPCIAAGQQSATAVLLLKLQQGKLPTENTGSVLRLTEGGALNSPWSLTDIETMLAVHDLPDLCGPLLQPNEGESLRTALYRLFMQENESAQALTLFNGLLRHQPETAEELGGIAKGWELLRSQGDEIADVLPQEWATREVLPTCSTEQLVGLAWNSRAEAQEWLQASKDPLALLLSWRLALVESLDSEEPGKAWSALFQLAIQREIRLERVQQTCTLLDNQPLAETLQPLANEGGVEPQIALQVVRALVEAQQPGIAEILLKQLGNPKKGWVADYLQAVHTLLRGFAQEQAFYEKACSYFDKIYTRSLFEDWISLAELIRRAPNENRAQFQIKSVPDLCERLESEKNPMPYAQAACQTIELLLERNLECAAKCWARLGKIEAIRNTDAYRQLSLNFCCAYVETKSGNQQKKIEVLRLVTKQGYLSPKTPEGRDAIGRSLQALMAQDIFQAAYNWVISLNWEGVLLSNEQVEVLYNLAKALSDNALSTEAAKCAELATRLHSSEENATKQKLSIRCLMLGVTKENWELRLQKLSAYSCDEAPKEYCSALLTIAAQGALAYSPKIESQSHRKTISTFWPLIETTFTHPQRHIYLATAGEEIITIAQALEKCHEQDKAQAITFLRKIGKADDTLVTTELKAWSKLGNSERVTECLELLGNKSSFESVVAYARSGQFEQAEKALNRFPSHDQQNRSDGSLVIAKYAARAGGAGDIERAKRIIARNSSSNSKRALAARRSLVEAMAKSQNHTRELALELISERSEGYDWLWQQNIDAIRPILQSVVEQLAHLITTPELTVEDPNALINLFRCAMKYSTALSKEEWIHTAFSAAHEHICQKIQSEKKHYLPVAMEMSRLLFEHRSGFDGWTPEIETKMLNNVAALSLDTPAEQARLFVHLVEEYGFGAKGHDIGHKAAAIIRELVNTSSSGESHNLMALALLRFCEERNFFANSPSDRAEAWANTCMGLTVESGAKELEKDKAQQISYALLANDLLATAFYTESLFTNMEQDERMETAYLNAEALVTGTVEVALDLNIGSWHLQEHYLINEPIQHAFPAAEGTIWSRCTTSANGWRCSALGKSGSATGKAGQTASKRKPVKTKKKRRK